MSLRAYDLVAPLTVYETLHAMRPAVRRPIEELLQRLGRQPGLPGDFEAIAEDSRTHQVKVVGNWMLSYWIDHAVREVRISNLERIE